MVRIASQNPANLVKRMLLIKAMFSNISLFLKDYFMIALHISLYCNADWCQLIRVYKNKMHTDEMYSCYTWHNNLFQHKYCCVQIRLFPKSNKELFINTMIVS